jgi:hypothetical protein
MILGLSLPRWQPIAKAAAVLGLLVVVTVVPVLAWPSSLAAAQIDSGYAALLSGAPSLRRDAAPTIASTPAAIASEHSDQFIEDATGDDAMGVDDDDDEDDEPDDAEIPTPVTIAIDRSGTVSFDVTDSTGAWRVERWRKGWAMFRANPIQGQGFGRPIVTYSLKEPPLADDFNYGLPHNTYLVSLIRQGIAGTCILGCIFLAWAYMILKSWPSASQEQRSRVALAAGLAVTGLVYGAFTLFFESPYTAVMVWMVVGATAAIVSPPLASFQKGAFPESGRSGSGIG